MPGTPWCVVWTGDGRVFFYNPSSRISVWERPDELIGRMDVEKMTAGPPETSNSTNKIEAARRADDSSGESSGEEDKQPAAKKIKIEDPKGLNFTNL